MKLYCCFIDYRKAFGSVNRTKLLYKLARSDITGTMYTIIKYMCKSLKTCMKFQTEFTEGFYFYCNAGSMQGETLSPFFVFNVHK